jgi:hypothetical protein
MSALGNPKLPLVLPFRFARSSRASSSLVTNPPCGTLLGATCPSFLRAESDAEIAELMLIGGLTLSFARRINE